MGESKQDMLLPDGRPMVACVCEAVASCCGRVVLLGESEHVLELARIADERIGCGPLGGIEALLASGMDKQYLIVPCDLPLVTADVLNALLIETDRSATVFEGRPLPARIAAGALPAVQQMLDAGERAVWQLMEALDAKRIALRTEWEPLLKNVNTPEDVARVTR
jgi:molybdenum cofactor guanylyltransferase